MPDFTRLVVPHEVLKCHLQKKKIPTWIIVCSRDLFGLFAVCRWKVEGGGRRSGSGWWTPSPLCRPGEGEIHWSQIINMWPTAFTYGLFRSEGTDPSAQNNETSASRAQHTACWFHAGHFWGSILQKIGLTWINCWLHRNKLNECFYLLSPHNHFSLVLYFYFVLMGFVSVDLQV